MKNCIRRIRAIKRRFRCNNNCYWKNGWKGSRGCRWIFKNWVNAEIINARFLKPFDENKIIESIEKQKCYNNRRWFDKRWISNYSKWINCEKWYYRCKYKNCGYDDEFVKQGSVQELEQINGLDCNSIVASCKNENIVNEVLHG